MATRISQLKKFSDELPVGKAGRVVEIRRRGAVLDSKTTGPERAGLDRATPDRRQAPDDPHGIQYGRRGTDKPATRKSQFFVTFCHWSMVALLIVETITGMRMGGVTRKARSGDRRAFGRRCAMRWRRAVSFSASIS